MAFNEREQAALPDPETFQLEPKKRTLDIGHATLDFLGLGLLLGDAMNGSHAPHERLAVDSDNSAIGKDTSQRVYRASIVLMTEDRSEHDIIGDVEVCV